MKQPKILVVDDDRPFALALSIRLRAAGYDVLAAPDAHSASALVLRERPDLILLDVDMPGYSGLEFHECLQFSQRGRSIPVVYLSGDDSASNRMRAHQQGARAFLSKPFEAGQLVSLIERIVDADASPAAEDSADPDASAMYLGIAV